MRIASALLLAFCLALSSAACGGGGGDGNPQNADCSSVTCSGHGTCSTDEGTVHCNCESGYSPSGLSCLPASNPARA